MRKLSIQLLALSLLSLMCVGAYGYDKDLKEHITLPNDVMVGNTTIKKGDYLVKYDAATSQASFMDGKNVVATAMATVTLKDKKASSDALYTKTTPEGEKLIGLRLGGQREELAFAEPIALIEPLVILPSFDVEPSLEVEPCGDCDEVIPTCEWVPVTMSDDMEEIVIDHVGGMLPDAEITNYKLVCQPW